MGLSVNTLFPHQKRKKLLLSWKLTVKPIIMFHKSTKDLEERCLEVNMLFYHL